MKQSRTFFYGMVLILLGGLLIGCHPRINTMAEAEKIFIKKVDRTAGKLDLNDHQKAQLEKLKADIRQNFQEGQKGKKEAFIKIKEEGAKENADIRTMTSLLQGSFQDESLKVNRAFDLLLEFQSNLNEAQKQKLTQLITDWVKKWE